MSPEAPLTTPALVALDADHPGFRDPAYRARRDTIARAALDWRPGATIPRVDYAAEEHTVWRAIRGRLEPLHRARACRAILEAGERVPLDAYRVPQLADVSRTLAACTGFEMVPVAGLVSPRDFLESLGSGLFPSTQYIRHASRPLYTPEPDVVHELIGHAASLAHDGIAEVNRAFGRAAIRATSEERIQALVRVYWWTLEFGLVREEGAPRALGAGLLSSIEEISDFHRRPRLRPFDLQRMARTPYDPSDLQPDLFVAPSLQVMLDELISWLA